MTEDIENIILFSREKIESLIGMKEAIRVMREAFAAFSEGTARMPRQTVLPLSGRDVFIKPAYDESTGRMAVKIITEKKGKRRGNLPAITGGVLLLDIATGLPLALLDGAAVTALRTGAAGGMAIDLLARRDAATVALFGCGTQGKTQLTAACSVRPVRKAFLYDTDIEAARRFKKEMEQRLKTPLITDEGREHLKEADIIITVTPSKEPLFGRENISPGVHINAFGSYNPEMQEIDPAILREARLFADSREAVLNESGDLVKPIRTGYFDEDIVEAEIGTVINGMSPGRRNEKEITVFKSVGLGIQDLYLAGAVYEKNKNDRTQPTGRGRP